MLSLKLVLLTRSLPVLTTDGSRVLEKKLNETQVSSTVFTHLKSIGNLLAGVHILSPGHRCFGSKPTHPRAQSHCVVSKTRVEVCATEFKRKRIISTDNENVSFYWVPLTFKRGRQNISRIENQWRKIEIFFIPPKHPFLRTSFENNILKFQRSFFRAKYTKVWKFVKIAVFSLPKRLNRHATLARCWQR